MIDLTRSWSIWPRLTISTLILLVAAIASCFALYAAGYGFVPALRLAIARPALVAVVAWWSLAAALPALWVGDVRRTPPESLLARFVIGNGFLATLVSAGSPLPLLVVMLLGIAALVPSLGWYAISRMTPSPGRVRVKLAMANFSAYVVQLALTLALFMVTLPPLELL
jgi:hypothetical protein